ncbi:MAG: hypothetical protein KDE33_07590 [Bacteroidetes bacterium]|nr:hypothetical protein [Bacteroidota bacterium]MCB9225818.1 hypothetical protein [Chitinophagales bacterium]
MKKTISKKDKKRMTNPFLQFFRFIYLNIKIISVVALGHGGTRDNN